MKKFVIRLIPFFVVYFLVLLSVFIIIREYIYVTEYNRLSKAFGHTGRIDTGFFNVLGSQLFLFWTISITGILSVIQVRLKNPSRIRIIKIIKYSVVGAYFLYFVLAVFLHLVIAGIPLWLFFDICAHVVLLPAIVACFLFELMPKFFLLAKPDSASTSDLKE